MQIPYRDLSVSDPALKDELLQAVESVLSHGRFILGPELNRFEEDIASYCRRRFAVGVGSGTEALYFALRGLDVGPGDEVLTTPLSWIATVNAIVLCGATPTFIDITEDLNINPELIDPAVTPKTKAIVPVHFTGRLCKMKEIMDIARRHELLVIEDAAQAFGAHLSGAMAGSYGEASCFSMNPMKVFGSYGEAGAVLTDSEQVYERLLALRYNGTINKENCHFPSLNGRMDTLQAAMMLVNLRYLEAKIKRLQEIARFYFENLNDVVTCPQEDGSRHIYYSYTIIAERRDELSRHLHSNGIETKIQHPILMPYHEAYRRSRSRWDIPVAERLVEQILCIPNHEKLRDQELEYIVQHIRRFYGVNP